MNIGSISVDHVGQAQPEGRGGAGPADAHAGGGLTPAAKHREEEGGGQKGEEKRVARMQ